MVSPGPGLILPSVPQHPDKRKLGASLAYLCSTEASGPMSQLMTRVRVPPLGRCCDNKRFSIRFMRPSTPAHRSSRRARRLPTVVAAASLESPPPSPRSSTTSSTGDDRDKGVVDPATHRWLRAITVARLKCGWSGWAGGRALQARGRVGEQRGACDGAER